MIFHHSVPITAAVVFFVFAGIQARERASSDNPEMFEMTLGLLRGFCRAGLMIVVAGARVQSISR